MSPFELRVISSLNCRACTHSPPATLLSDHEIFRLSRRFFWKGQHFSEFAGASKFSGHFTDVLHYQSVAVQPHWRFVADESGTWSMEMQIEVDTTVANKRELIAHALLKDAAKVLVGEL